MEAVMPVSQVGGVGVFALGALGIALSFGRMLHAVGIKALLSLTGPIHRPHTEQPLSGIHVIQGTPFQV